MNVNDGLDNEYWQILSMLNLRTFKYLPTNMGVSKNGGTPKTPQNGHF